MKADRLKPPKINLERRAEIAREKRERTRKVILDAAFEVLGHPQGRFATIDEVVKRSGIARGTFYNYFKNLEGLFEGLSYSLSHRFNDAVFESLREVEDAAVYHCFAVRWYLHRARQDHKWGWGMVNISHAGPIFGAETTSRATHTVAMGIKTGRFKISSKTVGRDLVLGTTCAAMNTILTTTTPKQFPEQVAFVNLLGLGVSHSDATRLIDLPLPDLKSKS
jgi:hypothetical protein